MDEANILAKFKLIKTFIFDMDGVLTDGTLIHISATEAVRRTNMKDGQVINLASKKGYRIAILSGSVSEPVKVRLKFLGVSDVFMNVENKKEYLQKYIEEYKLNPEEILYMGDDVKDYKPMQIVGLPCCPADAVSDIKQIAKYISPFKGGEGCVRDVMEKVLKLHGNWSLD